MSIKQNGGVFGRNPTFNDVTIEGQLTFEGNIDIDSDITWEDGKKALFGDSGDLQIYHDSSDSYIKDVGTGDLKIMGANVEIATVGGNKYFDGAVNVATLYHTNNPKLATTSSGVDVTGTAKVSTSMMVGSTDSPSYALHVKTNAGYTAEFQNTAGANHRPVRWTDNSGATVGTLGGDFTANDFILQGIGRPLVLGSGANGQEAMRLDASQNVSIPSGSLTVDGAITATTSDNNPQLTLISTDTDANVGPVLKLYRNSASPADNDVLGQVRFSGKDDVGNENTYARIETIATDVSNGSENAKMEFYVAVNDSFASSLTLENNNVSIPNGELYINGTSLPTGSTAGFGFTSDQFYTSCTGTGANTQVRFYNGNGLVGNITTDGSATAYNTSSDYRLKEDVQAMSGATDRLKELKPVNFAWKADGSRVDGFIAHEAQEVVPESVTGSKDAMQTEEYEVSPATGDIYTPEVVAVEGVEAVDYVAPVEAQEAVMGERQKMETVETGTYVNLAGETITETQEVGVTEEQVQTVVERQDIDGVMTEVEVEKTVSVPVMESYEVSPAVEAVEGVEAVEAVEAVEGVAEVIHSANVEQPSELEDGQLWRETTAQVMGEREVPDYQGIDQAKLVPLLVATIQELEARITALES
jgi:hypothetical protein